MNRICRKQKISEKKLENISVLEKSLAAQQWPLKRMSMQIYIHSS